MSQDQWSKPYSDDTATLIDDEVRNLVEDQYLRAQNLLTKHRKELDTLAQALLEREVLVKSDLIELIGPRPWPDQDHFSNAAEEEQEGEEENNNGAQDIAKQESEVTV